MKTAVIYARYSSDNQTEQSIEGQIRVCREFAQRSDILIVDCYIDRAKTGTNDDREDFQRLLRDSNKRQWDLVLVYKLDRFARNRYEAIINRKRLSDNNITLISATEPTPDTPEGKLFVAMIEGYNEYYSDELRQKVRRGLRESWEKGQYPQWNAGIGYTINEDRTVSVNERERAAIVTLFDMYSKGYTARQIADVLNEQGIRTKLGKTVKPCHIFHIIENPKYIGRVYYGGKWYENIFPRIIDDKTWEKVQAIRERNKHAPAENKSIYGFLLSGKMYCGDCGLPMFGESGTSKTGRTYYYYSCRTKRKLHKPCTTTSIHKDVLEEIVLDATRQLLYDDTIIKKNVFLLHQKDTADSSSLRSLEKRKRDAEKASRNLISAIEQGIITEQTKTRLRELESEIATLEIEINSEKYRMHTFLTEADITAYIRSFLHPKNKNDDINLLLVKTFVRKIVYTKDEIIITYNFAKDGETDKGKGETPQKIRKIAEQQSSSFDMSSSISKRSPPQNALLFV